MNISTRPDRNAVSGPSRAATDVEVEAIKVPVVSCKTAFSCLDRVCGTDAKRMKAALRWVEDIDERVLPLDRLMAIAENSGLRLRRAGFNWRDLLIATASKTVLLILRNGNIVAVLGTGRDGVEEIVVSDPLYLAGEPFFLPRVALEHAWDGEALIVRPKRTKSERAVAWFLSLLSICGLTAGLLLLFQAAIDVTVAGSTTTYGENAPPISASLSASNPPSQETPAAVSADIRSGADTTADDDTVKQLKEALNRYKNTPGVILDLRGNTGGDFRTVLSSADYFFPEKASFGKIVARSGKKTTAKRTTAKRTAANKTAAGSTSALASKKVAMGSRPAAKKSAS